MKKASKKNSLLTLKEVEERFKEIKKTMKPIEAPKRVIK